jgi:signal transduction histidine kinase
MSRMVAVSHVSRRARIIVGTIWAGYLGIFVALVATDIELGRIGRSDLQSLHGSTWIIIFAICTTAVIGSALVVRHPRHPVGWLFVGLAFAMLASGAEDTYAAYGALARPGSLPGARAAAVLGDVSFVPWLVLVALILHLTPIGRTLGPRWRTSAQVTVVLGVIAYASGLVGDRELSAPFTSVRNPMAISALAGVGAWVGGVAIIGVGVGLVIAAASLVVRFRRARGVDRAQLLWLVVAVIPMPLFVVAAFAASMTNHDDLTVVASGGFIVLVPVAVGLSITRYHLYDVDRILGRTITYVLLTVVLVAVYGSVVLLATRGLGSLAGSPGVSATLGAVTAAVLAGPTRNRLQDEVDRRFNRRRYDAVRQVRTANLAGWVGTDVEPVLCQALADPSIRIVYWLEERSQWVDAGGNSDEPLPPYVEMSRRGKVIARVGYDPAVNDHQTVLLAATEAVVALDNVGLRAELAAQVRELAQSRSRIITAQQEERQRIGRDLHDGAQQRLLALALQLQAAQLNGRSDRLSEAVAAGIDEARLAVADLRELANGLHPMALSDGGLTAALDDLARRSPLPVRVVGDVGRFNPSIESTAWFIACEAISNAQKHAEAASIRVSLRTFADVLHMEITDDGRGGANPKGSGLRGIRDRADASGGTLRVESPTAQGTTVTVSLPCAS